MSDIQPDLNFPIREAREIVKDLLVPNSLIYWADFLFHVFLGWGAFVLTLLPSPFSYYPYVLFIVSSLALFRAAIFIHELTHLKKDSFKVFRIVWNVLCGFPLMIPSFLYQGIHNDHHKRNLYGTEEDGEYFPFVKEGRLKIILFVIFSFLVPVIFFIRFIFLTPLSYLHTKFRSWVLEKVSSFCIDLSYRRTRASLATVPMWQVQEAVTCLYGWAFIVLVAMGILSFEVLILWYIVMATVFLLNSLRTLAAHRYRHFGHKTLDFSEQLLDSVNIPENLLAILWAPVGLRFHATHHLIPEIPYHSLGKAHRRILQEFSRKDLYDRTACRGLGAALGRLWQEAGPLP